MPPRRANYCAAPADLHLTPSDDALSEVRGLADGPLMMFLHGWPSIGLMWRAQMEAFAADGWHCVAPDLRGFGG